MVWGRGWQGIEEREGAVVELTSTSSSRTDDGGGSRKGKDCKCQVASRLTCTCGGVETVGAGVVVHRFAWIGGWGSVETIEVGEKCRNVVFLHIRYIKLKKVQRATCKLLQRGWRK